MKRFASLVLAAMLLAAPIGSRAQPPRSPAPVLIRAGNLFDSTAGRLVGARDILVRDGRIAEIATTITPPTGVTVIDLRGCTVLPGLIDAHSHLLFQTAVNEDVGEASARAIAVEGDALRALRGAARARQMLEAGFTSVRDLGNSGRFLDMALARAIAEGSTPGPRIYGSGPGLSPAVGQANSLGPDHTNMIGAEYRIVSGTDDARTAVREAVSRGARVIKVYPEATPNRARMSVAELAAIAGEAARHRIPVAAHVTSDAAAREAVEAGVASLEHAYEISDETLRLMARRGVFLVPTDASAQQFRAMARAAGNGELTDEQLNAFLAPGRDRLRRAVAAGVFIAAGSDYYFNDPQERGAAALQTLFAYRESGISSAAVLQSATSLAGRLLGDERLGVVSVGAYGDLIAVPGDPIADLTILARVRWVLRGGAVARDLGGCAG